MITTVTDLTRISIMTEKDITKDIEMKTNEQLAKATITTDIITREM
jgi:hypothetical protein